MEITEKKPHERICRIDIICNKQKGLLFQPFSLYKKSLFSGRGAPYPPCPPCPQRGKGGRIRGADAPCDLSRGRCPRTPIASIGLALNCKLRFFLQTEGLLFQPLIFSTTATLARGRFSLCTRLQIQSHLFLFENMLHRNQIFQKIFSALLTKGSKCAIILNINSMNENSARRQHGIS